jgi:hypothetical protein
MQGSQLKPSIPKPQATASNTGQPGLPDIVEVNAPPEKKPSSLADILAQQDELQKLLKARMDGPPTEPQPASDYAQKVANPLRSNPAGAASLPPRPHSNRRELNLQLAQAAQ